jgi:signal peptidase II
VSAEERDPGGTDLDQTNAEPLPGAIGSPEVGPAGGAPSAGPASGMPAMEATGRPLWPLFLGIAGAVLIVDQLSKAWVVASIAPTEAVRLLGDYLRLIYSRNDGALFGMFGSSAPILALTSLVVIGLVFVYHARSGRSPLLSIALGLLLGGALGNLLDRVQHGFVVDWVDMGLGSLRFWTFNLGDAAIDIGILLLIVLALWPGLGGTRRDSGGTGHDA